MSKHTPGPWTLKQMGVICGGPFFQYSNGSTQSQIAMATLPRVEGDSDPSAERDANARLIAAAPELLEAIKQAHEALRGGDPNARTNALRDCAAAIAKAEGKA